MSITTPRWSSDADGQILGKYRKMHIPDDPGFYEKFYFTPGDLGFRTFRTRYAHVGVLICWDQWFPEAARLAALGGAEIIFYPTAIGWGAGETQAARRTQLEAWELVQRSHAVTNGVYVAAVNPGGARGEDHLLGQFVRRRSFRPGAGPGRQGQTRDPAAGL